MGTIRSIRCIRLEQLTSDYRHDIVVNFQNFVNTREGTNITFVACNEIIKSLIKANLGRQLFDDNAFFEVLNKNDIMVDEVILLSSDSFLRIDGIFLGFLRYFF